MLCGTQKPHGGADFAKAEGASKGASVSTPWDGKVVSEESDFPEERFSAMILEE
jgi:hypothetical protein